MARPKREKSARIVHESDAENVHRIRTRGLLRYRRTKANKALAVTALRQVFDSLRPKGTRFPRLNDSIFFSPTTPKGSFVNMPRSTNLGGAAGFSGFDLVRAYHKVDPKRRTVFDATHFFHALELFRKYSGNEPQHIDRRGHYGELKETDIPKLLSSPQGKKIAEAAKAYWGSGISLSTFLEHYQYTTNFHGEKFLPFWIRKEGAPKQLPEYYAQPEVPLNKKRVKAGKLQVDLDTIPGIE